MGRNFGINRNATRAGRLVLSQWYPGGKKTITDHGQRFGRFCRWAEETHGVKKLEEVTFDIVASYGKHLLSEIESGRLSISSAHNYLSSVNTVMGLATRCRWRTVAPVADCAMPPRTRIRTKSNAMTESRHDKAKAHVDERLGALLDLQREFGLRFEESAKISPKQAMRDMEKTGTIMVRYGTKGGKIRRVTCGQNARVVLQRAASFQDGQSMIPAHLSYKDFRNACYRQALAAGFSFHQERHHFAQKEYESRAGAPPPIAMGWGRKERIERLAEYLGVTKTEAREIDRQTRIEIAVELGHNREEITSAYLG